MANERTTDAFLAKPQVIDTAHGIPFAPVATSNADVGTFSIWHGKLAALANLSEGWNGYSAPCPSKLAIETATTYLKVLEEVSFAPTRVEASVMGGVGITHRSGKKKAYLEFYNDGTVHSLFSDGTPGMTTAPVETTRDGFRHIIEKARAYLHA